MITVEHELDHSVVTLISDHPEEHDDVVFVIEDGGDVIMKQWNRKRKEYDIITFSTELWSAFLTSLCLPEGVYVAGDPPE